MKAFRRLAAASTLATLVLVTIGGLVRATKSGLGCGTDWPHCSGRLVPALESRAVVLEYSHRLAASVVVVLLGALAIAAWRSARSDGRLLWASVLAFALVVSQALLGAVVVKLELEALSVVLHLALAMILLGVLVFILIHSEPSLASPGHRDRVTSRECAIASGCVLLLLMLGSYVGGTEGAGLAFDDWPLMNGRVIPELARAQSAIHFAHRAAVLVVGLVVAVVCLRVHRRKNAPARQRRLARVALGAFALEVLVGAANVWTKLDAAVVSLHLILGVAVWITLVGLAVLAHPVHVGEPARPRRQTRPALDATR
jgi:cytochrome c oxidase assembly protein subunit 15